MCSQCMDPVDAVREMGRIQSSITWIRAQPGYEEERQAASRRVKQKYCEHQVNAQDVGDPNCVLCGKEIR
jgi:hypothetical protein